jgi:hypothetical protein
MDVLFVVGVFLLGAASGGLLTRIAMVGLRARSEGAQLHQE